MAYTIPPDAGVTDGVLTGTDGPGDPLDGGDLIAAVTYPDYYGLVDGAPLHTAQVDFLTLYGMSADDAQGWIDQAGYLFTAQGLDVLAFALWERVETLLTVPNSMCVLEHCVDLPTQLCVPFTDLCLPIAGQSVPGGVTNRLWLLLTDLPPQGPVLPQLSPFLLLLAPILLPLLLLVGPVILLLGIVNLVTGNTFFHVPSLPQPPVVPTLPTPGQPGQPGNSAPPKTPKQPSGLPPKPPTGPTYQQGFQTGLLIGAIALAIAGIGVLAIGPNLSFVGREA